MLPYTHESADVGQVVSAVVKVLLRHSEVPETKKADHNYSEEQIVEQSDSKMAAVK